ncbi:MAG: lactonase family protein [Dehalococcoidia bacterium]|nr:lactonase family protein [Dehalococcoidia bacterium]MCB9486553.1 lactonase family protein [Thermoflexaceae bacterium]
MNGGDRSLYAGTYTSRESEGIYRLAFNSETGTAGKPVLAARTANPSFVLPKPGGQLLYAVNELWEFGGRPGGGVTAFAAGADGTLEVIGSECTHGADPCHLAFDSTGQFLLVSNFTGGSLCVLPVRDDGSLEQASDVVEHQGQGHHPRRQSQPHVHSVAVSPGGLVIAADLGIDRLVVYRLDTDRGSLARVNECATAPGAGPRHMAFSEDGRVLFVSNELDSTITSYSWDEATGGLARLSAVAAATVRAEENSPAHLLMHPGGCWLFASNRRHDSIATFARDADGGLERVSTALSGGRKPRGFAIDPGGRWLVAANQDTDSLVFFAINEDTGELTRQGEPLRVPSPVWVAFSA